MFNKNSKISKVGSSTMRSDQGDRYGGNGFTDFMKPVNGLEKWKHSAGINRIDIIPYNASKTHPLVISGQAEEGDVLYALEVYVHKNVGPNGSNYVCLSQFGKPCPLCKEAKRLRDMGTSQSQQQSTELYAKRRIVYVVHDLEHDKYGWWDTGFQSVQKKVNALESFETDENGAKVNVYDWENGRTIRFMGTEKQFNGHKYVEPDGFNFAPRAPLSDEVLSHSVDLSAYLNVPSEETLEKILSGVVESDNSPVSHSDNTYNESASQSEESSYVPVSQPVQETAPKSSENVCPYGHPWGDADKHDECAKCGDIWEKCCYGVK